MFENKRIAVLGAGRLGEALITGMLDAGIVTKDQFIATAAHAERLTHIRTKFGIETTLSNGEAVRKSQLALLCVKPQTMEQVVRQISDDLTPGHLLISVAASVSTRFIEGLLDQPIPVIRTMPNTPCLIKQGMSAIAPGKHASADHVAQASMIFNAIGRSLILDEKHMDAVTGLSASGPAFVYIIIESFIEAGVKVGLPRKWPRGRNPAPAEERASIGKLKTRLTPAGCTIGDPGTGRWRPSVTLIKAVVRATQRSRNVNG